VKTEEVSEFITYGATSACLIFELDCRGQAVVVQPPDEVMEVSPKQQRKLGNGVQSFRARTHYCVLFVFLEIENVANSLNRERSWSQKDQDNPKQKGIKKRFLISAMECEPLPWFLVEIYLSIEN